MTDLLEKSEAERAAAENPNHAKRWWILIVLGIAQLMVVLDATIVNIALPTAQMDLGFNNADRQWIVTAYALAFGSLLLIGGKIADLVGRKRILIIGLIGFAAASAVGGAAVDFAMLAAARAVQGAFGALLAPAVLSLLATTFTDLSERNKAFGIFGAIAGAGASIGLLLGGVLTEYANWRWTLFVNLLFAAIAFFGASALLTDRPITHRPKLDIVGTVLVCAGLFCLVFGFSRAETSGWSSASTVAFLAVGVVLLVAFVYSQFRIAEPLLPMRIVLDRNRGGSYIAMFLSAVGIFAVFLFLTYYLQGSQHFSPILTGVSFLPLSGSIILSASVGSTILITKVSARILVPGGMIMAAVGMFLLTHISTQTPYAHWVLPAIIIMGLGMGLIFAPAFNLGVLGVGEQDSGIASAMVNTAQQVGGSVGTSLLNTIAGTAVASYLADHLVRGGSARQNKMVADNSLIHSYTTAFWWAAAIFVVGAVVVAIVLRPGLATDGLDPADLEAAPVAA